MPLEPLKFIIETSQNEQNLNEASREVSNEHSSNTVYLLILFRLY